MIETLEETTDPNEAQTAIRKLVFAERKQPEAIALSLQVVGDRVPRSQAPRRFTLESQIELYQRMQKYLEK